MSNPTDPVVVTAQDREAAAKAHPNRFATYDDAVYWGTGREVREIDEIAQAFARHRQQSLAEVMAENARLREVADKLEDALALYGRHRANCSFLFDDPDPCDCGLAIAERITARAALKGNGLFGFEC